MTKIELKLVELVCMLIDDLREFGSENVKSYQKLLEQIEKESVKC